MQETNFPGGCDDGTEGFSIAGATFDEENFVG